MVAPVVMDWILIRLQNILKSSLHVFLYIVKNKQTVIRLKINYLDFSEVSAPCPFFLAYISWSVVLIFNVRVFSFFFMENTNFRPSTYILSNNKSKKLASIIKTHWCHTIYFFKTTYVKYSHYTGCLKLEHDTTHFQCFY